MKAIDFHPDAAEEGRDAATRYESLHPGLGSDFRTELAATLRRIQGNPALYAPEQDRLRIAPLHRFPYSVIYEELDDRIWIAAIAHQSRRPGYWSRRNPD